jgi:FAD/FMN-containing dehydrogenase
VYQDRAALTARCSGTADVVDAVNFARERGLLVAVRGGGHSVAGLSTVRDGLMIDLSAMRGVQVDPERRLARVQGGALLGDVDRETQAFGLATPLGRVSETGVAGLTLGGGYGHLNSKYGLSCDNVVEAQVVCADGEVRTASAESNPDLYWAIRGGGAISVSSLRSPSGCTRWARSSASPGCSTRWKISPTSSGVGATTSAQRRTR